MTASLRMTCILFGAALLAACNRPTPPPDPAQLKASLIAADKAFAAATAAQGLEGWMAAFESTAIQMEPDVPFTPGAEHIRAGIAPAFADTSWHLTWEPTMAFASIAGDLGYTLGTWRSTRIAANGAERVSTGKYVTIWRKQADGGWKVAFDGGNPDTAPKIPGAIAAP